MTFVFAQIGMGWFLRPDPEAYPKARKIFNWAHRGGGLLIMILAVANVFSGIKQYRELWNDDSTARALDYAAIIGIVVHILLAVVLQCWWVISSRASKDGAIAPKDGAYAPKDDELSVPPTEIVVDH